MKNIAIIPAHGGSRRIKDKNIKDFCGKPIITYSIDAAKESGVFDTIVAVTDDDAIAKVCEDNGVIVLRMDRPQEGGMYEIVRHTLVEYSKREQWFENCCMVYATAPMITPEDFRQSIKLLIGYSAVIAVARDEYHFQRAMVIENSRLRRVYPYDHDKDSRDFFETYHHAEMLWWLSCNQLMLSGTLHPANTAAYIVPWWRACNIDTPEDWETAEWKYKILDIAEEFDKR